MLLIYNMVWSCVFYGMSVRSPLNAITTFAYCLRSRVLHVILGNPQTFGFESDHLRSLPCAFSRRSVSPAAGCSVYFSLLRRADETQPGRNTCPQLQFLAFSLDSIKMGLIGVRYVNPSIRAFFSPNPLIRQYFRSNPEPQPHPKTEV